MASAVKSDHKAVVAFPDSTSQMPKMHRQRVYRRHTPAQHAEFLQYAANIELTNPRPTASSDPAVNAQAEFDHFLYGRSATAQPVLSGACHHQDQPCCAGETGSCAWDEWKKLERCLSA